MTQVLRDQGAALAEVTIVQALDAIRKQDFDQRHRAGSPGLPRGLDQRRRPPEPRPDLHGGRASDEAGKEFHRAVELGPGVPENWLAYVQYLVQAKQLDQARAVIEAARKALPADRATSTLAQCSLAIGDAEQAEALIKQAMDAEGKADDLAALRLAVDVSLRQNRLDKADRTWTGSPDRRPLPRTTRPGPTGPAPRCSWPRPAGRPRPGAGAGRQNLADDPESVEDQSLRATILALRPARRGEAVAILEHLAATNRLGDDQRFLLAQLYLGQGEGAKYQDEMLRLLDLKARNPRHLAHFVNHWIGRNQLDQADRWLAELKKADPRGLPALELEARLLDLRKRRPELLALLEARGREVPDQIGAVADLLNRYGFAKEAEAAYKAFVARDPKQPERVLALAQFLARQDRVGRGDGDPQESLDDLPARAVSPPSRCRSTTPRRRVRPRDGRWKPGWPRLSGSSPTRSGLASKLGVIWIRQGRFDEAEGLFRRLLAGDPDNADALNNLAWLLALPGQGKARGGSGADRSRHRRSRGSLRHWSIPGPSS